jgi:hypothetical protein
MIAIQNFLHPRKHEISPMGSVQLLPPLIGNLLLQFRREVALFVGIEKACAALGPGTWRDVERRGETWLQRHGFLDKSANFGKLRL